MQLCRYTNQTRIRDYYPIPRRVLELELPSTAILLYGMLLERATLSQKNGYFDLNGWIYVIYTQEELAQQLSVSTRIVSRYVGQLEEAGLLKRFRRRQKHANQYYLYLPDDSVIGTGTGNNVPAGQNNCSFGTGTKVLPNKRIEQKDIINLYQYSEEESL